MVDKKAKALIFDIDGTLVDSMPVHYKACQLVCNEKGFDFPIDFFYAKAGIPTVKVFEMLMDELQLPHNGRELALAKDEIYMTLGGELQEITPIADIVREFYRKLPMALGTGADREMATMNITATRLEAYFEVLVAAEDVKNHKPHPDTFLKCAEYLGVPPEFCQVFEDGDMGIEAARTAGMMVTDIRKVL